MNLYLCMPPRWPYATILRSIALYLPEVFMSVKGTLDLMYDSHVSEEPSAANMQSCSA